MAVSWQRPYPIFAAEARLPQGIQRPTQSEWGNRNTSIQSYKQEAISPTAPKSVADEPPEKSPKWLPMSQQVGFLKICGGEWGGMREGVICVLCNLCVNIVCAFHSMCMDVSPCLLPWDKVSYLPSYRPGNPSYKLPGILYLPPILLKELWDYRQFVCEFQGLEFTFEAGTWPA